MHADAHQQQGGERADRPVRAVVEVDVLGQRALLDQEHGDRPDVHGADEAEAESNDDRVGGDGERADHAVEGERAVQHFQVEEEEEPGLAAGLGQLGRSGGGDSDGRGGHRLVAQDVGLGQHLAVLQQATQAVHGEVGQHAQYSGDQDRQRLVGQEFGDQQENHTGDQDGGVAELADLGQRALDEAEPVHLARLEDEVQEQHEQEQGAEGGDLRVRLGQDVGVAARRVLITLLQGQLHGFDRAEVGAHTDDHQRQDQPHAEHGDQDAHGEEHLLPERVHALQDLGVDHGVVEGQRHLEDTEDQTQAERFPASVEESHEQRHGSDAERPAERTQNHDSLSHAALGAPSGYHSVIGSLAASLFPTARSPPCSADNDRP